MRKKLLFITGSINQTSQMHQIAQYLPEYECWFSQIFADSPFINWVIENTTWADRTVLAGQFRKNSEAYCKEHGLLMDYKAQKNHYDLVVYCSDLIIPDRMLQTKTLWVQEGMIDECTLASKIVKKLHLPPYLAIGTSLNGSSNICDIYCAASEGYKNYFAKMGTDTQRILPTGIPNFDNCQQFLQNDLALRNYVLVTTSDIRECFRPDDRVAFIKKCVNIANGRPLIFKLHPNEVFERAIAEIKENTPEGTQILTNGNANHLVANCDELITQYSTLVYVGIALGKKVHSYFEVDELQKLAPIQNEGTSAQNIAQVCRDFVEFSGKKEQFVQQYQYRAVDPKVLSFA
ncbi:hypothetical protein [Flectobacillus major]|jgi:hypothetical protein|uniref:hypothetical protein n=1 Tax=Flectobacillus major TaxID=103 RepID=UPI0005C79E60|nr:hypothetical protein [Flectobacillus major]